MGVRVTAVVSIRTTTIAVLKSRLWHKSQSYGGRDIRIVGLGWGNRGIRAVTAELGRRQRFGTAV